MLTILLTIILAYVFVNAQEIRMVNRSRRPLSALRQPLRHILIVAGACALALRPDIMLAHDGSPPTPQNLWRTWSWEPSVLLGLALAAWLYESGMRTLWRRAGIGRGIRPWQAAAYVGGLSGIFVALISPLDPLGSALFAGHMLQHLVLTLVAAPLLVLGAPLVPFLWALPRPWRRGLGRWLHGVRVRACWRRLNHPLVVWGLYAGGLWLWHLPILYQATLRSEWVHVAQHSSFLGTALLFWWAVFQSSGRKELNLAAVLSLFTTMIQSSLLGVLLTFSNRPWYPVYTATVVAWGLTPLEDQQLAGLIMWVPASLVYVLSMFVYVVIWLGTGERETRRREIQVAAQEGQTEASRVA